MVYKIHQDFTKVQDMFVGTCQVLVRPDAMRVTVQISMNPHPFIPNTVSSTSNTCDSRLKCASVSTP